MKAIRWQDGTEMRDRSWAGLLRQVNLLPWNKDMAEWELRKALAKRAFVWSMIEINTHCTNRELFEQLEKAGALEVLSR